MTLLLRETCGLFSVNNSYFILACYHDNTPDILLDDTA
jgi:hypothetical protein